MIGFAGRVAAALLQRCFLAAEVRAEVVRAELQKEFGYKNPLEVPAIDKIQAAIGFLQAGGKDVIITSPGSFGEAMNGTTGTVIHA